MSTAAAITDELTTGERELFERLTKDLREASALLSMNEARYLVDQYYMIQDMRIRAKNQLRQLADSGEPNIFFEWIGDCMAKLETSIKNALGRFAGRYAVGQWCQAQYGIGPVLSAAMLSNFDVRRAKTAAGFWRFAGLDPTLEWKKGQKRPFNAQLKSICAFKLGESFVKFQNREACFYGRLLAAKKALLAEMNDRGEFKDAVAGEIEKHSGSAKMKKTERWKHWQEGKLAPANIHDRARRWVVKLFISHLFDQMWRDYYATDPPPPYVFSFPEKCGVHTDLILPPLTENVYDGQQLKTLYGG